jgi:hypothetical protein
MKYRGVWWGAIVVLVWGGLVGTVLGQQPWGTMGPSLTRQAGYTYGGGYVAEQPAAPSAGPAAAAPSPAAEESCGLTCLPRCCTSRLCRCGCLPDPWTLFPEFDSGLKIGGWISAGILANAWGADSNGPIGYRPTNDFTVDQTWLFVDKKADTSCRSFDWGFRFDILFGADGPKTRAFNNSRYAWDNAWISSNDGIYGTAIPQLYAVVAWNKLSVKMGHFFSPLGYETVPVTQNFFYSHSYCHQFGEPQTMTGVLASYAVTDGLNIHAGWTTAWDTAFDNPGEASLFLGGVDVPIGERITFTWMVSGGDRGERWGLDWGDLYMNSFVVKLAINDRWTYVFQHDLGLVTNAGAQVPNGQWYGINQYLFFKINDCWSLGGRFEWFHDDDGLWIPNVAWAGGSAPDYYALTLGLNWKPHANLTIRPEIRYDWANGRFTAGNRPFNDGADREQFSGGVDLIFTY